MELPQQLIDSSIRRGSILHTTIFEEIDHGKFFVVIGVSNEYVAGFFFINSRINKAIEAKPEQFAMQYPIKAADYDFLTHDSFVCASEILKLPVSKISTSIIEGQTQHISQMQEEHIEQILEAARQSKLFSPRDKRLFFYQDEK